ncbi:cytidine deaminase [Aggregatibacter actinomycetemcomitans]|uniref:cytidine deaminase n=1 Tax=Aggregatibacter actinomycetemcomitans TaxID=714 RepID=UPI00037A0E98|nr:cytidine deaminase [Aggregatibacter actinomycetemcomitans]MCE3056512.1 cytidine deaminase [Aggregatibacter actinomycetemcomitans]TYB28357.1 cytidine deaminase [Aggregatibacter actinomycetemcomitans]
MSSHISDKIQDALGKIEHSVLAQDIWHILQEQKYLGFLPHFAVQHLCNKHQLTPKQLVLKLLPIAACYATTPISHFNVGAVVHGIGGDFYFGANQEFCQTDIQQTIHAEQSAISHAWMRGEKQLTDVTVNYTPCGHCRQFMNELNSAETLQIHLPHSQNNLLHQYLPDAFGPKDLNIQLSLLDQHDNQLSLNNDNPLVLQALAMANQAHAPYSNSFHGIAIQTRNQQIYHGSYAENAAFNPSLPAMQVALNHLILSGEEVENIVRVVMVEKSNTLHYKAMAEELLGTLSDVKLDYFAV